MKEIFLFNNSSENIVDTFNLTTEQMYKNNMPTGKESKNYFRAYIKKAEEHKIKIKSFNFNICGPSITKEAIEFANYINIAIKEIDGIKIRINVFSLEQLINEIKGNIPKEKWYILNSCPSICWSKEDVSYLVYKKIAMLIN